MASMRQRYQELIPLPVSCIVFTSYRSHSSWICLKGSKPALLVCLCDNKQVDLILQTVFVVLIYLKCSISSVWSLQFWVVWGFFGASILRHDFLILML